MHNLICIVFGILLLKKRGKYGEEVVYADTLRIFSTHHLYQERFARNDQTNCHDYEGLSFWRNHFQVLRFVVLYDKRFSSFFSREGHSLGPVSNWPTSGRYMAVIDQRIGG